MIEMRRGLLPLIFLLIAAPGAAQQTVVVKDATVGSAFSLQIAWGGLSPYTFKLLDGTALPPGLAFDERTGSIIGTPTQAKRDAFTFTVLISDDSSPTQSKQRTLALKVRPAPLMVIGDTAPLEVIGDVGSASAPAPLAGSGPAQPAPILMAKADAPAPQAAADPAAKKDTKPTAAAPGAGGGGAAPATATPNDAKTATDTNAEWEARAIVGYHQAGASSAKSTQNYFFDFFISRALSSTHLWGPYNTDSTGALLTKDSSGNPLPKDSWTSGRWSLWGDVRVASAPQQVTTGVGAFVSNFSTNLSNVPVNQLAESAEFQTGLEFRLHTFVRNPTGMYVLGYRTLGLVANFGAMGSFEPPASQMQIFDVPGTTSPQYPLFAQQFPGAANAKYVGFVPPDRQRFYRNYGIGFRVTTFDRDQPLAPPGTYTFTVGQDESITGGIFRSVVGRFEVFYPLPMPAVSNSTSSAGGYKFLYLFGTANLRFSKAVNIPTFGLQDPNATSTTVQSYDPNLAVVEVPSTRDTYRIGVGVDLVNLIQSLASTAKTGTTAPPAAAAAKPAK